MICVSRSSHLGVLLQHGLVDYSTAQGVRLVFVTPYSIDFMLIYWYNSNMKTKVFIGVPILAVAMLLGLLVVQDAHAVSLSISAGANAAKGTDQATNLFGQTGTFRTITNVLLYLIGAISVIMLIVGGLRYVVSGGDSTAVQGAKNTILYAIVGIVVAILAYAIVSFVITSFTGTSGGGVAPTNT